MNDFGKCPYCRQRHKHVPRACMARAEAYHRRWCGLSSVHLPGCVHEAMKRYVARLRLEAEEGGKRLGIP